MQGLTGPDTERLAAQPAGTLLPATLAAPAANDNALLLLLDDAEPEPAAMPEGSRLAESATAARAAEDAFASLADRSWRPTVRRTAF